MLIDDDGSEPARPVWSTRLANFSPRSSLTCDIYRDGQEWIGDWHVLDADLLVKALTDGWVPSCPLLVKRELLEQAMEWRRRHADRR